MRCSIRFLPRILVLVVTFLLAACTAEAPLEARPGANSTSQAPSVPLVGVAPPVDNPAGLATPATTPAAATSLPAEPVQPTPALTVPAQPAVTTHLPPVPGSPIPGMELYKIDPPSLDLATQAGAYWIRRNALRWALVEPAEGERRWEALAGLEQEMKLVAESGGRLILVVRDVPGWAQAIPGMSCGRIKTEKLEAFAAFMQAVVARYSAAPYQVQYWEIGNEPDVDPASVTPDSPFGCMGDKSDAYFGGGEYAALLKAVYPPIKAADPASQVLVGGLLMDCDPINPPEGKDCRSALFLEGALKAGAGDYFDGVSFHGYDFYFGPYDYSNPNWHSSWNVFGPVFVTKARYLRSVLTTYGHSGKYLLNTEAGLLCGREGDEPPCQAEDFLLTKAAYVAEMNFAALEEGLRGNIWFSLVGWRGTQLVDSSQQPNQAYQAYRFAASQLLQATFDQPVNDFPGVRGYQVSRPGHKLWFLLPADGQSHTLQLPFTPTAIYDVLGAPQPPAAQVRLEAAPLYIEWVP